MMINPTGENNAVKRVNPVKKESRTHNFTEVCDVRPRIKSISLCSKVQRKEQILGLQEL